MLKLILCMVIVVSSTLGGFYFSNKLSKRKTVLESFELELMNTSTKIRYNCTALSRVFENNFMGYTFDDSRPFSVQWCEMLKGYINILTGEDIRVLSDFSKNVGTLDLSGELSNINLYIELIRERIKDAEKNIETKSKLYQTFGASLGLCIAILLI